MSRTLIVDLRISADEFLRHYQGSARHVSCYARDGRRVQFPTSILQRFISHNGIAGSFKLELDENNKLISVSQVGKL
ncbi:hypothetical protein PHACT_04940 [Pseudohongiella acticola]|jgi:Protein of unknown function (DUF2835)|uniref:Topoisomerase II n=1 Tax=Pseudohongiella acticola TaxID=1524254 RepID=A0A1E8CJT3_9GAMM|nr:DUF2835 domain-containing protein [Pseudohongiella acticola]OFE12562.1 hypothetical protein PHACT_04940 [Pseudohongiella acticola]|tara:strand:- start:356 stop:586 length:231 start_codon:yes stop_codon:yes gene_type:complete